MVEKIERRIVYYNDSDKKETNDKFEQKAEITPIKENDGINVFTKVDIQAQNPENFFQFLKSNLNVDLPAKNGAKEGYYIAIIRFIVRTDGSLIDFKQETKNGFGIEDEAMRVLRLSANWQPAEKNGIIVSSYCRIPITFLVAKKISN
ncbi:MAG: hypothetical protein IPM91_04660 [Bacteroidetes bacterium]|nr:hypothetical protein [Bacteroidota bacterium]